MSEEQKRKLEQQLWNIADTLRGRMNADEFRDYALGFIFYKYLSEKFALYANEILKNDGIKYEEIQEKTEDGEEIIEHVKEDALLKLGYFLRPSELFGAIAAKGGANVEEEEQEDEHTHGEAKSNFILEDLTAILNNIENSTMGTESEQDFNKLFEDLDLTSTKLGRSEQDKNKLIAKILAHLNNIDFKLGDTDADILGDAYEYLIGKFASGAGKKAGEFYTPQPVSTVLAKLVTNGKKQILSAYDPTCGSGSLLLRIGKEVEVANYYGQELNRTTYNLARMNMILHDVHFSKFDIRQDDTLEHPAHLEERFEAIVANPPFSAKWSAKSLFNTDDRFSQYGRLAPKSAADFAFVQHMIYQLAENGIMAIVLPHGVLFRGGAEAQIRQYLIEERNYLDAVIGLPANMFYGTSIPTCILVFKKCKEHPNDILFIDSSNHFEKVGKQNRLRKEDISKIIDTYTERKAEDKYSYVATLEEVKENDYNLNIPRYVDTFEEEEPVDIEAVANELKALEQDIAETDKRIADYCQQLNIPTPF